jgi:hypothetical protein
MGVVAAITFFWPNRPNPAISVLPLSLGLGLPRVVAFPLLLLNSTDSNLEVRASFLARAILLQPPSGMGAVKSKARVVC